MKKERVLVTGASGMLGSFIIADLINSGYSSISVLLRSGILSKELQPFVNFINIVQGDILELYPLDETLRQADYVVHGAAMVSFDPKKRKEMYTTNVIGTQNIVNLCLSNNIKKMVHISSVAAIGRPERSTDAISEKTPWSASQYNSYYGLTKYKSELEVWRGKNEGLKVNIINPSIILGTGNYNRSSLKMFPLINRGLGHYPTGKVGIVDARDVARMATLLMESSTDGERYIATATSITYKKLFENIAKYIGAKPPNRPMTVWMSNVLWRMEKVRSMITNTSPIVTKETMKSSFYSAYYDNKKSKNIPQFFYTNVDDTIRWVSEEFVKAMKN